MPGLSLPPWRLVLRFASRKLSNLAWQICGTYAKGTCAVCHGEQVDLSWKDQAMESMGL